MTVRLGIDVGGTFTDLIFLDDATGQVCIAKEPTTPSEIELGVASAVNAGVPKGAMSRVDYLLHGTTVALNALLERTGVRLGLLTTAGFRDVLEIGRGEKAEMYNLFWRQPPALVPRHLRLPVRGRIRSGGNIDIPFHANDVESALETFRHEGVEAIAVAFINAYANGEHEVAAEQTLRRLGFEGDISLSHRVSPEYREFPRTCTTVIDTYVRSPMGRYLRNLETHLRDRDFTGDLYIARSGGGAMSFEEAEARSFETLLSGPVGGAAGAAEISRQLGLNSVIAADVGGTSFDTCLIRSGSPNLMYEGNVIGLPIQGSWMDIRTIGAGGGSIAHLDTGGLLRVGPGSSGSDPGPAAYGRGGKEPTVTDAACFLGMIPLAATGGIQLDVDAARTALAPLADALSMDIDGLAHGIILISSAAMSEAIREITVEKGQDPRDSALMAYGGAGPLFSALIAGELEIGEIVIPPFPGILSAWGLAGAEPTREAVRMTMASVDDQEALGEADEVVQDILSELKSRTSESTGEGSTYEVALDMRYVGQDHTLTVPLDASSNPLARNQAELASRFEAEYAQIFDHNLNVPVEIVSVRGRLRRFLPRPHLRAPEAQRTEAERNVEVNAYSFAQSTRIPFRVVGRSALQIGEELLGPAIVREQTATTYVDENARAVMDEYGCLRLYVGVPR